MGRQQFTSMAILIVALSVWPARPSSAAWPTDGVALSTAERFKSLPTIASDGQGGAIMTWIDDNDGDQIYAQRVTAAGATGSAISGQYWPDNGRALTAIATNGVELAPAITSDGDHGAIVVWNNCPGCNASLEPGAPTEGGSSFSSHNTGWDLFARRVLADGTLDTDWATDGEPLQVCATADNEDEPRIVSDGQNGVIITWYDTGTHGRSGKLFVQRVGENGHVLWGNDGEGVELGTGLGALSSSICSDGSHGAIVAWKASNTIYAQRVSASDGAPQWGIVDDVAHPVVLCNATGVKGQPQISSDGSNGAIVTWEDFRNSTDFDIYAQRVTADGHTGSAITGQSWPDNGRLLCDASDDQQHPQITSDDSHGALVTWQDKRNGTDWNVLAQHVSASGVVDSNWPTGGRVLCGAGDNQELPSIVEDGASGAIVTWQDSRRVGVSGGPGIDIYAQRVSNAGALVWSNIYDGGSVNNGVTLCAAAGNQVANRFIYTSIAADGAGGAIVTWEDARSGTDHDIYARRAQPPGAPLIDFVNWGDTWIEAAWTGRGDIGDIGTPVSWVMYVNGVEKASGSAVAAGAVQDVEADDLDACTSYDVYVKIIGQHGIWSGQSNTVSDQTCCTEICGETRPLMSGGARAQAVEQYYRLALAPPHPNPAKDGAQIRWSIPRELTGERFRLAVFDVSGRKVATVAEGTAQAGLSARKLRSRGTGSLTSGVYFLRLQIGDKQLTRSLILTE